MLKLLQWRQTTVVALVVSLSSCAESVPVQADAEEIETAVNQAHDEASQAERAGNTAAQP
jgi:hypothetical protein